MGISGGLNLDRFRFRPPKKGACPSDGQSSCMVYGLSRRKYGPVLRRFEGIQWCHTLEGLPISAGNFVGGSWGGPASYEDGEVVGESREGLLAAFGGASLVEGGFEG